jgi:nitroimidazol reductase NimA-like FMN-containing flavoprotein (pyridoxamine 5'-phosphate oxidase superfamily)
VTEESPASAFEKRWASVLLEGTIRRLEEEFAREKKRELFDRLQPHLWGDEDAVPYAELSIQLGTTPAALKMAALRLRRRFRELLRQEIAITVETPEEIDLEIQHLMEAFSE